MSEHHSVNNTDWKDDADQTEFLQSTNLEKIQLQQYSVDCLKVSAELSPEPESLMIVSVDRPMCIDEEGPVVYVTNTYCVYASNE